MRRCEDEKMRRCEDVKMFGDEYNRHPLLEQPFAQTLSGTKCTVPQTEGRKNIKDDSILWRH